MAQHLNHPPKRFSAPLRLLVAAASVAVLAGCASTSRPVVYAEASKQPDNVQVDIAACRQQAEKAVGVNGIQATKVASASGRRGAVEFVDRAVEQVVVGSRNAMEKARGAAAGAVAGGLTSVALNWNEPDSVFREHVDLCMKERGHKVLGWR